MIAPSPATGCATLHRRNASLIKTSLINSAAAFPTAAQRRFAIAGGYDHCEDLAVPRFRLFWQFQNNSCARQQQREVGLETPESAYSHVR
jgi:hypothetical protein